MDEEDIFDYEILDNIEINQNLVNQANLKGFQKKPQLMI